MYRVCRIILVFPVGTRSGGACQNANDILGKAAAAYENSNGISASFTMFTRSAGQNAGESFEGTIQMKGDKFTLVTPDALTWLMVRRNGRMWNGTMR